MISFLTASQMNTRRRPSHLPGLILLTFRPDEDSICDEGVWEGTNGDGLGCDSPGWELSLVRTGSTLSVKCSLSRRHLRLVQEDGRFSPVVGNSSKCDLNGGLHSRKAVLHAQLLA